MHSMHAHINVFKCCMKVSWSTAQMGDGFAKLNEANSRLYDSHYRQVSANES